MLKMQSRSPNLINSFEMQAFFAKGTPKSNFDFAEKLNLGSRKLENTKFLDIEITKRFS